VRLEERKENILDFVVRQHVRAASPISSLMVSVKKQIDLSPATIRNIMLELDNEGFLFQPHTSAGRIPTKKGYKYFVDNLMEDKSISLDTARTFSKIFSSFEEDAVFDKISYLMAEHSGLFAGISANGKIFKYGLSEVLREPEFEERDFLLEFAEFADNIEDNLNGLTGIRIGNFSVVSSLFGPKNVVFIAGPRRMDYEKASSIIKFITKNL